MALVIGGNLAINGSSGSPCVWTNVDITSIGGTATASYVTVTGSVNSDETSITVTNGTDGGGNTGWSFGGAAYTETLDGALTTGGNLADTFTPGAVSYQEDFAGLLQTGGDLAPVITYALDAAGALQSGGDLADTFDAGAVTYTETLDGALQSGGDLIPVVGYGLALDGLIQSGGNLVDTFTTPGNFSETFSGALTTGGDLVPVLSSSIAAIGSLDTGGDLVVFVSYAQTIDGLLQTGGDLADTFTDATGAWSEVMAGALHTGGDLVPVAQWGVLVDGVLVVGGNLADAQVSLEGEDITGLDIEYKAIQAIYKTAVAIGAQYRKAGHTATPIRVAPISDDLAQLGAAELGIRGLIRSVTVRTSDVATPSRGDYVSFRNTTYRVAEYRRISEYEWQLYVSA